MDFFDDFGRPRPTGDAKRKAVEAILARSPLFAPAPPSDVALTRDAKAEQRHDFAWGIDNDPAARAERLKIGYLPRNEANHDDQPG